MPARLKDRLSIASTPVSGPAECGLKVTSKVTATPAGSVAGRVIPEGPWKASPRTTMDCTVSGLVVMLARRSATEVERLRCTLPKSIVEPDASRTVGEVESAMEGAAVALAERRKVAPFTARVAL